MEINRILSSKPRFTSNEKILGYDAKTRTVEHIISSNGINCYGYRLLTSGYDDEPFAKAGVVLMNHMRGDTFFEEPSEPSEIIVGKSLSRRIEGDLLIANTQFAETELGNDLNYFYGNGMMKGWSVGWDFPELSDAQIRAGEKIVDDIDGVPTVLKWYADEYSAVYLNGNKDAVTLNNMLKEAKSKILKRKLSKDYLIDNAEQEITELRNKIEKLNSELDKNNEGLASVKQLNDLKNEIKSLIGKEKKELNDKVFGVMLNINQLPSNLHNRVLSEIPSLVESVIRKYIGKVD